VPRVRNALPPLLAAAALVAVPRVHVRADDGAKLVQESCGACHDAKTRPLGNYHLTREKWKEAVEKMEDLGAEIPSGKKLDTLLDYLAGTHGPEGAPAAGDK
jgi:cytochrome c5